MNRIFLYSIALGLALFAPRFAMTNGCESAVAADAESSGSGHSIVTDEMTYYTPGQGSASMEGGCQTSTPGYDACKGRLDNVINGQAEEVVVATQQQGEGSKLFGCYAKAPDVGQVAGKPDLCAAMADHYAKSENEGKVSKYNGRKIGKKFDVSTDRKGPYGKKISSLKTANFTCVGRLKNVSAKRKVTRNPGATSKPKRRRR